MGNWNLICLACRCIRLVRHRICLTCRHDRSPVLRENRSLRHERYNIRRKRYDIRHKRRDFLSKTTRCRLIAAENAEKKADSVHGCKVRANIVLE